MSKAVGPMSGNGAELYEEDFVRWAEAQAAALREAAGAGLNLALDWENLAEEVEDLARSQRRELRSRLRTILEHLLKLEHSPAAEPRPGWRQTVLRERADVEDLLADSPSLKRDVDRMIAQISPLAARLFAENQAAYGETSGAPAAPAYTEEQVLGDWFPEPAKPPPRPARRRGRERTAPSRGAS